MRAVEILALNFVKGIRTLMDEVGFETHQDEPALARCFGDEGEEIVASNDVDTYRRAFILLLCGKR